MVYKDFKKALVARDRSLSDLLSLLEIFRDEMDKHVEGCYLCNEIETRKYYIKEAFEYLQCYIVLKNEIMKRKYC